MTDFSTPAERVKRYAEWQEHVKQSEADAEKVLNAYIIDLRTIHATVTAQKRPAQTNAWRETLAGFAASLQPHLESAVGE